LVGVARPWGGQLGQVDHGHGAVSLGSGSGAGHTRVDLRRYLPTAGTTDQARLATAGVPTAHRG
jgi:SRSO17 transposase